MGLAGLLFGMLVGAYTTPASARGEGINLPEGTALRNPVEGMGINGKARQLQRSTFPQPDTARDAQYRGAAVVRWGRPPRAPEGFEPNEDEVRTELEGLTGLPVTAVSCVAYPCAASLLAASDSDVQAIRERITKKHPDAFVFSGSTESVVDGRVLRGTWFTIALLDQPIDEQSLEGRFVRRLTMAMLHRSREANDEVLRKTLDGE